jgi:secondary thiamine-phosphate synthase enzyme
MQQTIRVSTDDRLQTVEITDRVAECVPDDLDAGTCHVFSRHTTAAVLVNEDEPRLRDDLEGFFADLVPDSGHRHDELDDNADSHLRAALVGPDATVPVRDGELAMGTWQSIFLVECDGPRERGVVVTVTATE